MGQGSKLRKCVQLPAARALAAAIILLGGRGQQVSAADPIPVAELNRLLAQVDSDDFDARVAAEQELARRVEGAPQRLLELLPEASPEAQVRLVGILEGVFLRYDDHRGDQAEKALEEVARSTFSAAGQAQSVLRGNSRLRESRACAAIKRLGGALIYVHPSDSRSQSLAPQTGVGFGEPAVLQTIFITEIWKGTPADLWHLERLSYQQNLILYNIRGSNVPFAELLRLTSVMPGLTVAERGGCLGIKATPSATTAEVGEVVHNSAAERAGLRPDDRILKLNDEDVINFPHLVSLLLHYSPGDEVQLEVERGRQLLKVPVKLTSWTELEKTSVPEPPPFVGPLGQRIPPVPALPEIVPMEIHSPHRFL